MIKFLFEEDFTINKEYDEIIKYFKDNEFTKENFPSFDKNNYFLREISDDIHNLKENKGGFEIKKQKDDFITITNKNNWREETKRKFINLINEYESYLE